MIADIFAVRIKNFGERVSSLREPFVAEKRHSLLNGLFKIARKRRIPDPLRFIDAEIQGLKRRG